MNGCRCALCTQYQPRTLGVLWDNPDGTEARTHRSELVGLTAQLRAERISRSGAQPCRRLAPVSTGR